MSTKNSLEYDDKLDMHVYQECDNNYYLETGYGTVMLNKKMAEELAELLRLMMAIRNGGGE